MSHLIVLPSIPHQINFLCRGRKGTWLWETMVVLFTEAVRTFQLFFAEQLISHPYARDSICTDMHEGAGML